MSMMDKLLVPAAMQRVVEEGHDYLCGPVIRTADHAGRGAAERVGAHGLEGEVIPFGPEPEYVDVIRFETTPLMVLTTPTDIGDRPWPTYPLGFLRDATLVWELDLTRVPMGARFVRVGADGGERVLSEYGGAAWGWQRAKGYVPPVQLIGPRVKWRGLDLPASYAVDQESVELVWVGEDGVPEGFTPSRPRVHALVVPMSECEQLFEVVVTALWREVEVRVEQQQGEEALVVPLQPTLEEIDRLGAQALEPSLFQATVPTQELSDMRGVLREPAA